MYKEHPPEARVCIRRACLQSNRDDGFTSTLDKCSELISSVLSLLNSVVKNIDLVGLEAKVCLLFYLLRLFPIQKS